MKPAFKPCPGYGSNQEDDKGRCKSCGQRYHCHLCKSSCSMMGHAKRDDEGDYYYCQDYERYERANELAALKWEHDERKQLQQLAKKYGYSLKKIDPKFGDE